MKVSDTYDEVWIITVRFIILRQFLSALSFLLIMCRWLPLVPVLHCTINRTRTNSTYVAKNVKFC